MEIKNISDFKNDDPEKYFAQELIEGNLSNVRIIRLAPEIALPPHKHGSSDLMLYVVEGSAKLEIENGQRDLVAGDIAFISPEEELRVSNQGSSELTLLAFLSPKFPAR
jgi:quercetin dioxygenase-like cupin family protein